MGKKSIIRQVLDEYRSMIRFGESKHEAKKEEKARCEALGEAWNPARVEGIFSFSTYREYVKEALEFAEWARDEKGCKTLEQAREYVSEYLQRHIDSGYSAWSVRKEAAALAKLYHCRTTDFGVEFPARHREEIERSRGYREHDREFSKERNRDIIIFAKATGLRRRELEHVSARDVYRGEDGRLYVHVENGKGGRERDVHVLQRYEQEVERIVRERADRDRLFDRVPVRMDVHGYRREYARERYREVEREISRERKLYDRIEDLVRERMTRLYPDRFREIGEERLTRELTRADGLYHRSDGREFDRLALWEVSNDLGHNRIDVVARHYLD
ncbi:site-specific integrase [Anaerocellum diazotrophicum]|uniref:Tyr recombinase domain-containing protein n=1 Tax=Caldicellulosiruptor diazotrophicus TaxID=2806205 RepID=A0ABM7NQW4_9FIRM|nr:site-specific integrase [Caldicellulosiruptor diazotrophicus]BCS82481.1 hypothetical protein CaldiYA01_24410 [Caldicellulosiruptor diazotrophicus]